MCDLMQGIILSGGKGTRLSPLSNYIQKCMIPIAGSQKPVLEYIVKLMKHNQVKDILMLANYKANQIKNYFGDGTRFDLNIKYVLDEEKSTGTGGAILNAQDELNSDRYLIYYGDIISTIDLSEMLEEHKKNNALLTVALARGFAVPVGVANVEDNTKKSSKVIEFLEKPKLEKAANMGIYIMEHEVLDILNEFSTGDNVIDLNSDLIPYLMKEDMKVYGYLTDAFWYDIGSLAKYEKLDVEKIDKEFKEIL